MDYAVANSRSDEDLTWLQCLTWILLILGAYDIGVLQVKYVYIFTHFAFYTLLLLFINIDNWEVTYIFKDFS